jgi:membrane-bound lytic murein transglycosylase D
MIEQVFDQEGLPRELLWVGLVESGYDPMARSPKNAVGIWQLIPETAETFGLSMSGRDERTNPLKSTRAAARYLKFLYARFGDWPLTLAAYNAGERRVQSAIVKGQTTDFWRLAESGLLPRETQAYVPAVMAAQYLGEERLGELADAHDSIQRTTGKVVFATIGVSP